MIELVQRSARRLGVLLSAVTIVGMIFLIAPSARAGDWSARTRLLESVEASDNRALDPDPAGNTYLFTSQLMVDAITRMQTMSLEFNADLSYQNLTGPGSDQNASPMDNTVNVRFENRLADTLSYDVAGRWQRRDATTAQLDDTGIVIIGGDINTYVLQAGINRQINPRDAVRWQSVGTVVDFTSDAAASFTDLVSSANWMHRLTPRANLTTDVGVEWLARDNPASGDTFIARATYGLETPISADLAFKGSLGASFHTTDQEAALGLSPASEQESSVDGLADLNLIFRPLPTTEFVFRAAHWTGPNVLGEIESRTVVGASMRRNINQLSSLWLATDYTGQIPIIGLFDDGDASYVRASIGYDYRLTADWIAQASYKYAYRTDQDLGSADSNTLFLSAVYEATILP
jgi:hypothetical protein